MNNRLFIGFLAMVPVISVQAADKASGSLVSMEKFNFAADPLKSFALEKAFGDKLRSKGLGEAFSSVLLLAKLQNAPIDSEIISAIDECKDDFYRGVLKKELVLKKINEHQVTLDDERKCHWLSSFIARNCSEADIDSLMQRAGDEVTSELPFLQDVEQDEKQAHDLKSQEKFNHLQHLRLILKLESRIREQKEHLNHFALVWISNGREWVPTWVSREEQARLEAQRREYQRQEPEVLAEFDRLMGLRQEEEQARIELERREEAQRQEDAYNNRNFILRFIGNLFPPR